MAIRRGSPIKAKDVLDAITNTYPEWLPPNGPDPPVKGDSFSIGVQALPVIVAFVSIGGLPVRTVITPYLTLLDGMQPFDSSTFGDPPDGFTVNITIGDNVVAPDFWGFYHSDATAAGPAAATAQAMARMAVGTAGVNVLGYMLTQFVWVDPSHLHFSNYVTEIRVAGKRL